MEQNLFVDNGREQEMHIATSDRDGVKIARPLIKSLRAALEAINVDVVIIDPFVASHAVPESDNPSVNRVATLWRTAFADTLNCAVELVHHVRKTNGEEVTLDDMRGAVSLAAACRSVRIFNPMSEEEALQARVQHRWQYFREDTGKANLAPREAALWRRMVGVRLPNGDIDNPGDDVGVATVWEWQRGVDQIRPEQLAEIMRRLREDAHGADTRATDWAGHMIGDVLLLDVEDRSQGGDRAQIMQLIRDWIGQNVITRVMETAQGQRRERPVLRPVQ
jgi:hypothetical protein